ncbi:hypothetical protein VHEMI04168 [[Torrubiella] hemipterigena]|uniref:AGC-kinase C-terminal domain-containing protein n=1 Tax=[Torrubiella] hemipterigena TaxID=1531966 RepID=A0A0A1TD36_9HYPO|nr:hypothetical protein VHEMI04168 [[Torrubiella] hemipterigena]
MLSATNRQQPDGFGQEPHHVQAELCAMLEFGLSQVRLDAVSGTIKDPVWTTATRKRRIAFDVFRRAELTIRLYVKPTNLPGGAQDIFLGGSKIFPQVHDMSALNIHWCPVVGSTGKVKIELEYKPSSATATGPLKHIATIGDSSRLGYVSQILKTNTNRVQRLGSNGTLEIKSHPFFDGIDWDRLARREYEPAFKPPRIAIFFEHRRAGPATMNELLEQFSEFSYIHPTSGQDEANVSLQALPDPTVNGPEDWALAWEETEQRFYFCNRSTRSKQRIETPACASQDRLGMDSSLASSNHPSSAQVQAALAAALLKKYLHLVPEILAAYRPDVNFRLGIQENTPLEYAAELENVSLVQLLLDNGAAATVAQGKPLEIATRNRNLQLVKMFIHKTTDRVVRTKALGTAVSQRDTAIVAVLLAHGVRCDFDEADQTFPFRCCGVDEAVDAAVFENTGFVGGPSPDEYLPPLVRAVYSNDEELVKLLLAHGANVNAQYHDALFSEPSPSLIQLQSCGTAVHLAIEMGFDTIVRILLDSGANIYEPVAAREFHTCQMIPRETYLKIAHGLQVAVAAKLSAMT